MRWSSLLSLILVLGCDDGAATGAEVDAAPGPAGELTDFVPGPMAMRRLSRGQYLASVRAVFGQDLEVLPPNEVDARVDGLTSLGASAGGVTAAGLERYELAARQIAERVLAPGRRDTVLGCSPAREDGPDDACAEQFVDAVAPALLRRPLRVEERATYVRLAGEVAAARQDFHAGLGGVLVAWLLSPEFLFIQERAEVRGDVGDGARRLTGPTLAARLSYFLWNQGPDPALIAAAADGALDDPAGYRAAVDRLLADPERLERGVRAFFTDLYALDSLDGVEKDRTRFPQFTSAAIEDAREQTLRTIVDHLLTRRADYRDLFTTPHTFMSRNLGPIYAVPVAEDWAPYTFPAHSRRAGILSHVSVLALHARASRSSPVLRGLFVLDALLCRPIPPPPADVNFETLAPESGAGDTARERLAAHRAEPRCAGCHDLIDPIGLALENFDAIGQFRTHEGAAPIDTHGTIEGIAYNEVTGFYQALRDTPRVTACLVRQIYSHAVGRAPVDAEAPLLAALQADFSRDGHDFVGLLGNVVLSHGFQHTSGPKVAQ